MLPIAGDGAQVQMSVCMNSILGANRTLAKNLEDSKPHFGVNFLNHLKTLLTAITLRAPRDLPHGDFLTQGRHFSKDSLFSCLFFFNFFSLLFLESALFNFHSVRPLYFLKKCVLLVKPAAMERKGFSVGLGNWVV